MGGPPRQQAGQARSVQQVASADDNEVFKRPPHFWSTLVLMYLVCLVEGADAQLLPSTFRALEASLGLTPVNLATLGLFQAFAMSISAPLWGALVDHGWSRKWILSAGTAGWAVLTMLLALVTHFPSMIALRALNGLMLGTLTPISQSLVADMTRKEERGFFFGWGHFAINVGQITCSVYATSISQVLVFGHEGWRVAFATIAGISLALAVTLVLGMWEPARSNVDRELSISGEFRKFRSYLRIDTFKVIVLQGMFGSIPWSALSFSILYFQYCGISDNKAAIIFGMTVAGQGFGALLGGVVGDQLSVWSRDHGRPLTAQLSVLSGIPLIAATLTLVPRQPESFPVFLYLLVSMGLLASWCAAGVNKPILTEIVDDRSRASVYSWLTALEGSSAACFGAPVVGVLAERLFGYRPTSLHVTEMDSGFREANAQALSEAMLWCTVAPWTLCLICYTLLHWTYAPDVAKVEDAVAPGPRPGTALL